VVHEIGCALDSCICEFAYFLAVISIPSSSIELLVEFKDELCVDKVGKCISHITSIVVIDR